MNCKELDPKKIFLDRDRDGITDTIDLQLHLHPSCSNPAVLSAVMDFSASLGFETMGMNLPLVKANEERDPSFHHHLFIGIDNELEEIYLRKREGDFFMSGDEERSLAKSIRDLAFSSISRKAFFDKGVPVKRGKRRRKGFDLLNLFSNQGFYCSSSKTPLPVILPYKIILFSHLGLDAAAEAANFTARLGLESLSLSLPLAFPMRNIPKGEKNFIYIGKKKDLDKIDTQRSWKIVDSDWESGIFLLPTKNMLPHVLICGEEKGLGELLKHLSSISLNSKGVEDPVFNLARIFLEDLKRSILSRGLSKETIPTEKIVMDYTIPDEKKEILGILREEIENRGSKPNTVEIQVFLTRPEKVRREFEREIKWWLKGLGMQEGKTSVTVLNAYKPGLSWMKEECLRQVSRRKVDRIEIAFKEFRDHGLEEPIRWLQEIYPVDEIFAASLSIPKEKIEFKKDSRMKEIYRVRAWQMGRIVYERSFSPRWTEQSYLTPFPRLGKVHPTTGWVKMKVDGTEIVNQRVKTGIERVWEIYQKDVISSIEKEANKVLSAGRHLPSVPVFEELRFDVYSNYPMEPLNIDEERVSPLEAVHEELYFVTLDFFSNLLKRKGFKNLLPGRIIPIIHPESERNGGRLKFTLVHRSKKAQPSQEKVEIRIALNRILFNRSEVGIEFSIAPEKADHLKRLQDRLRLHHHSGKGAFNITKICRENDFWGKSLRVRAVCRGFRGREKLLGRTRASGDIPLNRPIGYQEGVKLIHSFDGLQGVKVIEEGRSFGGRPLYSIENTYPCHSFFVSHRKRIVFKPTLFINCRHHGNEISSTNASLKLSYLLVTKPQYQRLLKKANVVLNPMENVDGMVILEEMSRWAPTDKLHAGRYNGAGQEYYKEYLNSNTPFGEARVKPSIWERWLPDICVDNHGFPSHEWDQPFSGYAPYRFRDFWIPRALLYVYLPHIEEKSESRERFNAKTLGDWISWYISEDRAITELNEKYSERYYKYRGQWLGKSSRIIKKLQFLPLQKKIQKTNYSYLQPDITAVDFITEVADETAWGNRLKTCISAHLKTNLAVINLLNNLKFNVKKIWLTDGRMDQFIWHRERPLEFRSRGASKQ